MQSISVSNTMTCCELARKFSNPIVWFYRICAALRCVLDKFPAVGNWIAAILVIQYKEPS